jgi:RNA polymerase sigma-70 factor (ECF subfamily)
VVGDGGAALDASADPLPAAGVGRVRAVLALGGVPTHELDDGVQQVRLKLLEQAANRQKEEIRDPVAWAVVVASRVAVDWHRGQRRDEGLRERVTAAWVTAKPEPSPEDRLLALTIADGMADLPELHRQVLTLRFYADLPVRDIALALDVPEGTVKSRLHAAVAALRERLAGIEVS